MTEVLHGEYKDKGAAGFPMCLGVSRAVGLPGFLMFWFCLGRVSAHTANPEAVSEAGSVGGRP